MRVPRWMAALLGPALFALVAVAPNAQAQIEQENSIFTISEPVEVGGTIVPPGTYLIRIVRRDDNRSVVQITSEDRSKVFATALATPHPIRPEEESSMSRFVYYPAVGDKPKALRTWISKNTGTGQDLVYSKARAEELASASKTTVTAYAEGTKETEYETAPLTPVGETQVAVSQPAPPPPAPEPETRVAEARPPEPPPALPATASRVPAQLALGLLALGLTIAVGLLRRVV